MSPDDPWPFSLALVMPVYNEEGCIGEVIRSWRDELSRLGIAFQMIVLNDGSNDATAERLEAFRDDDRIEIVNKPNSGHGPTILQGYRLAVKRAPWVFQTDSDNEMKPERFGELWERREEYDALFGRRQNRAQTFDRRFISAVSAWTVRVFFGSGVRDVNTPYRLMRSPLLARIIEQIPDDALTPNILISGALARAGLRILNHPVPHEGRKTGKASIVKWGLWKFAFRAFWQCLRCRPRLETEE